MTWIQTTPMSDLEAVRELVERHAECWRTLRLADLAGLWDTDDDTPISVGEELRDPLPVGGDLRPADQRRRRSTTAAESGP